MSYVFAAGAFVIAYAAKIALVVLGAAVLGLIISRWYYGMKLSALLEEFEDKMHR
jgi:hypothetical protein